MEISMDHLSPGERGKVVRINATGDLRQRLLAMGLLPGVEIELVRIAPLGDPLDFKLRNFHLSMRKNEARNIIVERFNHHGQRGRRKRRHWHW
ncbi:MAG: ferrous iron transport protein A [Spirochaetes bacterium]|nr:ferrous iron transport protein A [Spirochaetota bacterium]